MKKRDRFRDPGTRKLADAEGLLGSLVRDEAAVNE